MEHPPRESFSSRDALRVASIVDNEGLGIEELLAKVHTNNIDSIIRKSIALRLDIRTTRHRTIDPEHPDNPDIATIFKVISPGIAAGHAVQCSVNAAADITFLRTVANSIPHGSMPEDAFFNEYTAKMIEREKILSRLFHIDIIRRIAKQKSDPELLATAKGKWTAIQSELQKIILDTSFHEQAAAALSIMQPCLNDEACLDSDMFYTNVCMPLSTAIFADFRMQQPALLAAVQELKRAQDEQAE